MYGTNKGTGRIKLDALTEAFRTQKGEVYVGDDAWEHLEQLAGDTMSRFLELYVRGPIQSLLRDVSEYPLDLSAKWREGLIDIQVGSESLHIERTAGIVDDDEDEEMPSDADDAIPGS